MPATPVTVGLFIVGFALVTVVGVWLMLRIDASPADRGVARGGARITAFRDSVRSAAVEHAWQIEDTASRTFPHSQIPRRAEPGRCEFSISGATPRPFRADTWAMKHRNPGGVASSFVQHRLTVPLRTTLPPFAATGDGNWRTMLATIPDHLVSAGRSIGGLTVYGDDSGAVQRLLPLAGELKAGELWMVIDHDEMSLIREGELDAAGLTRRIDLANRLAAALEG